MPANVLYIHSHDTGRYVQPYGHAIPTPNIQWLADQGIMFRNAFCAAPSCSGSRAALLTGEYCHTNGMMGLAHRGFSLNDYDHQLVRLLMCPRLPLRADRRAAHLGRPARARLRRRPRDPGHPRSLGRARRRSTRFAAGSRSPSSCRSGSSRHIAASSRPARYAIASTRSRLRSCPTRPRFARTSPPTRRAPARWITASAPS